MARSLNSKSGEHPRKPDPGVGDGPASVDGLTSSAAVDSLILVGERPTDVHSPDSPGIVRQSSRIPQPLLQDLAVTHALGINSQCLELVSLPRPDEVAPPNLHTLTVKVEQLLALWQLMSRNLGRQQARQSATRMGALMDLLPCDDEIGLATQELLDNANDRKTRAALRQLMDEWRNLLHGSLPAVPPRSVASRQGLARESLSRLLQRDSAAWRHAFDAQPVADAVLLKHGFGRTYRRARKLSLRNCERSRGGLKRLRRWRRRVIQVVGQLELLELALGDANKETLWHLTRLQRVLAQRIRLRGFIDLLESGQDQVGGPLAKAYARGLKAAKIRDKVLERRAFKLCGTGFKRKWRPYTRAIAADSANIRL